MAGRPKILYSEEQKTQMQEYALAGCQNNTIATLMDIPIVSLVRHFGKILTKKRCERKLLLRQGQAEKAIEGKDTTMLIWLGKNVLSQTDKMATEHSVDKATATLLGLIDGNSKGKLPSKGEEDA